MNYFDNWDPNKHPRDDRDGRFIKTPVSGYIETYGLKSGAKKYLKEHYQDKEFQDVSKRTVIFNADGINKIADNIKDENVNVLPYLDEVISKGKKTKHTLYKARDNDFSLFYEYERILHIDGKTYKCTLKAGKPKDKRDRKLKAYYVDKNPNETKHCSICTESSRIDCGLRRVGIRNAGTAEVGFPHARYTALTASLSDFQALRPEFCFNDENIDDLLVVVNVEIEAIGGFVDRAFGGVRLCDCQMSRILAELKEKEI